ncbi:ABC transporter substrate-binding protein [Scytonema sp. PRP1]|uniref:ABC transporter substrate-binding protein n=1 Tax=Scytonema sp. PRP1 TaxID=3120513 RepID=UPI002FCEA1B8
MKRKLQKFLQRLRFLQILGLIFALLLCIKLLSACTNQSIVTLSFVVPEREAQYWKPLIEQFQQTNNQNIRIDLANFSNNFQQNPNLTNDLKKTYISDFKSKSASYDLIYMDIIWVPEFAHKEWVMDLTQEFPQEELRGFIRSEVDSGRYEDKLYRIPFRADVGVLFYRQDWLNEVKQKRPETFNDLLRISQKVKQQLPEKVQYGYLWQSKPDEGLAAVFVEVLYGYGGFWINNKKVGLNQPEAIQAVEFLRDTIKLGISPKDITTYDEQYTRSLFRDRQAVFMRNWPNVWLDVNGSEPSFRGKIAIKPMVYAEGKRSVASKGGWGFGIAKNTKHKKEALQAIKFFTSAASQQKFTLAYASVPSRRNLFFEPKIVAKYSHYPELLKVVENSVARPRIPQYAQASCILQKYLSEALNPDNNGYKQAMDAAAKETQNLLDSGKYNCQI